MPRGKFDLSLYEELFNRFQLLFEPDLIHEICEQGKARIFEADVELIDIGQLITHVPIVLSGSVKIMSEDVEGRELFLYYLKIGDTCAVTFRGSTVRSKSRIRAITASETGILFLPIEKVENWMNKYESWRNFILVSYDERLKDMLATVDSLAFDNLEHRLIKYLKDKALVTNHNKLNITHHEIATDLNSSRVAVSRILKKLETDGIVKLTHKHVEVIKPTN